MTHSATVLDAQAIADFRANHVIALDDCLPADLAQAWAHAAFKCRGIDEEDRTTWPAGLHFMSGSHAVVDLQEFAPRALQAIGELVGGLERLDLPVVIDDTMVVNTDVGAEWPWHSPATEPGGWHVDGDYNHFLDSPESGLMVIILYTEVHERGGATWIAPDSIAPVARLLLEHPQGISAHDMNLPNRLFPHCRRFMPLTGPAGRIYLMHPFMLHSVSWNELRHLRAIRNLGLRLRQPMQFDPDRRALSEVERATLRSLDLERLHFQAPSEQLRFPTDHKTGAPQPVLPVVTPQQRRESITMDARALDRLRQAVGA
jgi:hypothetical protein